MTWRNEGYKALYKVISALSSTTATANTHATAGSVKLATHFPKSKVLATVRILFAPAIVPDKF